MIDNCLYKDTCKYKDNASKCNDSCIRYNQMRSLLELSNLPKNRQRKTQIFPIEIDEKVFDKLEEAKNDIV
ncbi:MAG: hypothetical protein VZS44_11610, partial [Bacilli bacterium]|nr:hypothetical protein [Bacilli bacterium]